MSDIAAEIAHDAEWMGQECFDMGIRRLPARRAETAVRGVAAVETDLVQAVHPLADLALFDIPHGPLGRIGEIVIEVTAQIEIFVRRKAHHLARLGDVVGDGLFDQHVLPCIQRLHDGVEVPAAVLIPAGGDVDDIQIGARVEHLLQAVVGR